MTGTGGILLGRVIACIAAAVTVGTAAVAFWANNNAEPRAIDPPDEMSLPVVEWTVEAVDTVRNVWDFSSLAIDNNNVPHIAYADMDKQVLMYATKRNGTWVSEVVDDTDLVGDGPSIAIDSGGRVHIAYGAMEPHLHPTVAGSGPDPIIVNPRYAVKADGGWELQVIPHNVWGAFPSLALDSLDRPRVAYGDWNGWGTFLASYDGAKWNIDTIDPEGALGDYLALDSTDTPHVLYSKWDNWSNVFYATWNGSSWNSEKIGPGGYFYANLAIDTDDLDRPRAFWGGSRSGVKTALLDGTWIVENVSAEMGSVAMTIRDGTVHAIRSESVTYYGSMEDSGWSWEIVNSSKRLRASSFVCHCLAVDSRGQPHTSATVSEGNATKHLYYFSRMSPTLTADAGPDRIVNEGDPFVIGSASGKPSSHGGASEGGSGLDYSWDLDDLTDSNGDGNLTNDPDEIGTSPTTVYGDDGVYVVTLTVIDAHGNVATDTATVTVLNSGPTIESFSCAQPNRSAEVWVRITGQKWNEVSAVLYKDLSEVGRAVLVRHPGDPGDQEMRLGIVDSEGNYSAVLRYSPEEGPDKGHQGGANPAWLILRLDDGTEVRIHHTFNQQHPETWNWTVTNLEEYLAAKAITCIAIVADSGSDDLMLDLNWGDGTPNSSATYHNDGTRPDALHSPGGKFPVTATYTDSHTYAGPGTYTVGLRVLDDDGGIVDSLMVIVISP